MSDTASPYTGSRIDHLNVAVPDLDRSIAFYSRVLEVIGIETKLHVPARPDLPEMHGFGVGGKPFFWLIADGTVGTNMHVAFTVGSRDLVRRFYDTALAAGATPLHSPAAWTEYHPDYYGGFVLDPDGINLEAVCHEPADRS
ncbi:VOC family protein [Actinophytocola algeriensis]|uniref:Catechol 2,3-dioxygenase-like lactoylglutathione lyase family enzyme n=1 Tax=Actinophytocola algeriensis TaxID=1768010 RepID=A0A7W7VD87_9PSEU|nr:VOC family protein [Actinophytocola algeriensis]MBB4905926.1 catechol 2,3-dioxygenase-like lactoylglutathione lyase family enzyme [Actinophytocola algeriensis]MBE1472389.1 catechol 2,3-dioxygenase-like lactoylglutathione lyase family enzyme [Actinophytocola algeriensis]